MHLPVRWRKLASHVTFLCCDVGQTELPRWLKLATLNTGFIHCWSSNIQRLGPTISDNGICQRSAELHNPKSRIKSNKTIYRWFFVSELLVLPSNLDLEGCKVVPSWPHQVSSKARPEEHRLAPGLATWRPPRADVCTRQSICTQLSWKTSYDEICFVHDEIWFLELFGYVWHVSSIHGMMFIAQQFCKKKTPAQSSRPVAFIGFSAGRCQRPSCNQLFCLLKSWIFQFHSPQKSLQ